MCVDKSNIQVIHNKLLYREFECNDNDNIIAYAEFYRFTESHVNPSISPSPFFAEHGCRYHVLFLSISLNSSFSVSSFGDKAENRRSILMKSIQPLVLYVIIWTVL